MATLRSLAITLLRLDGHTKIIGVGVDGRGRVDEVGIRGLVKSRVMDADVAGYNQRGRQ
ncbi:hypothetical protein LUW76_33885 [Actinomadura madurae]|uniref:hypothetical protein n=1 Tax=Actinomadura madurae TaxID=1993 RepID=UPI002026471A|nr:hypothetical protein [Actinomadura madurae]URM98925.1 hypothetical protein LUW76_33885 [Actinomadura madurae]URN09616.1 hypothetical protein LUW74_43885 [Actinomadura madurae]